MPTLMNDYDLTRILPNISVVENQATAWLGRRDFAEQIRPTHTQRITLIVAASYILAIGILWCAAESCVWPPEVDSRWWSNLGMCRI